MRKPPNLHSYGKIRLKCIEFKSIYVKIGLNINRLQKSPRLEDGGVRGLFMKLSFYYEMLSNIFLGLIIGLVLAIAAFLVSKLKSEVEI